MIHTCIIKLRFTEYDANIKIFECLRFGPIAKSTKIFPLSMILIFEFGVVSTVWFKKNVTFILDVSTFSNYCTFRPILTE